MLHSTRSLVLASLTLLAAVPAFATRRLVPQQYATIQAAIQAAQPHDTVLVSPGTYFENLRFGGKNIVVAGTFLLNRQDLTLIRQTIINGSQPTHADTASVVRFINGEDSTAVLMGFTLTGGTGTLWPDPHSPGTFREGGAILAENASPTIRFNYIVGNQATNATGGVSAGGGGVRVDGGRPRLLNNVIVNNQGRYGAGVVINFSGAILRNNVIAGNRGGQDYGGGGVWINGAGPGPIIMENNTIAGNASTGAGGGVHVFSAPGSALLRNNILWANSGGTLAQISNPGLLNPTYNDVEGATPLAGQGNLNQYPVFQDSSAWLSASSPAVDAGNPAAAFNDPATGFNPQVADFPAQGTPRNDMGAYGGPASAQLAVFSLPNTLSSVTLYRFTGGQPVGTVVAGQLTLTNQGTGRLRLDSITVKAGSALTLQNGGSRPLLPFFTDTLHFSWNVGAIGTFVDTIRIYHHDASQPNPRVVRVLGTGRPTGLPDELVTERLSLWPNPLPAHGAATVGYRLATPATVSFQLMDALGRTVWQGDAGQQPAGDYQHSLPAASFQPGLYVLRLRLQDGSGTARDRALRLTVAE